MSKVPVPHVPGTLLNKTILLFGKKKLWYLPDGASQKAVQAPDQEYMD